MDCTTHQIEAMYRRLEKVEKQNRLWRAALLCLLAVIGSLLLLGQASPSGRTITAEEFVLQDKMGRKRAVLSTRQTTEKGKLISEGPPILALYDEQGRNRAHFRLMDEGNPDIWLGDGNGKLRAAFGLGPDGTPALLLFDESFNTTFSAP